MKRFAVFAVLTCPILLACSANCLIREFKRMRKGRQSGFLTAPSVYGNLSLGGLLTMHMEGRLCTRKH